MTSELRMTVRREEAVLVRVIGLVVRRGFEPTRVCAAADLDFGTVAIAMRVESERDVEVLVRQLLRLNEVERVEVMHGGDTSGR